MTRLLALFLLFLAVPGLANVTTTTTGARERKLYVGANSTEAILKFKGKIQIESVRKPSLATVKEKIDLQVGHTFGPMAVSTPKAVTKGDFEITAIVIGAKPISPGVWQATYSFTDTAVIEKSGTKTTYDVIIPVNPDTIYAAGMNSKGTQNVCTDHHYQDEGDFWYFWDPEHYNGEFSEYCPLVEGKDYLRIAATFKRLPNTRLSYPEYDRLLDSNNEVSMHVFFGLDSPEKDKGPLDPFNSPDENAKNYKEISRELLKAGYEVRTWEPSEIRGIAKRVTGRLPYVQDFTKVTNGTTLRLRFFFGETGIDENSRAFHWFYKDALENASIQIYGGHSGLGGHLNLESIEEGLSQGATKVRLQPNKNQYQIYFFDSCTSYTYYNSMYFGRKVSASDPQGSKNLDIMTNGLATTFDSMPNSTVKMVVAVEKAVSAAFSKTALVSWQTLAKEIDSDNLFGVNGDEDNPLPTSR